MTGTRMTLGNQAPFVPINYSFAESHLLSMNDRYWPKPYERLFERINNRLRYKPGPRAWEPGRYRTSLWQPTGYGRFSGIAQTVKGAYHAERYSGVRKRPEDYFIGRESPEWIAADAEKRKRRNSWRMAA